MPKRLRTLTGVTCGVVLLAVMSLGLAVVAAPASGASTVTKTVITLAETAGDSPYYIFPYVTSSRFTGANLIKLQSRLYRTLYSFSGHGSVTLNENLSLAQEPVFSNGDKTVAITMKTYKWSNGTQVDATDVLFWMNIWKMKPTGYGGWFPGGLSMPTSVTSVKITSPKRLTMTFDRSFNPHWLLYNELSQITPLPLAWTKSSTGAAAGSAGCATATFGTGGDACKAVYDYLSEQSGFNPTKPKTTIDALPTYATNPLWKVVDGPWTLSSFGATADVVFKPNPSYSGPNKPHVRELVEKPFTTDAAEFNALVAGTVDVGYLPTTDITAPAASPARGGHPLTVGKNNPRLPTYTPAPFYDWGVNYFPYNFKSTGDTGQAGKIFSQLYFRQAVQHLVDQTLYDARIYKGYAYPIYGPVPSLPKNPFTSKAELVNPYPYSVSTARKLLASHGWKVVPGGTSFCEKPGVGTSHCGAGIKKGAKLSFTLQYLSGKKSQSELMSAQKSSWEQVGIHFTMSSATAQTVYGAAAPCPKGCAWEFEGPTLWGYFPDLYPTGEEIFATGAEANYGTFTTRYNDALIKATDLTKESLTTYENYLEKKLPVMWQPEPITVYEIHNGLKGAVPLSPLELVTPATYYWST
jgi:peptide/nickel transport system substrate-binding protein